jgi:hypothetical protein
MGSYQYGQFLWQSDDNPRDRWGLFLKAPISDDNPNIIQNFIIGGIGGPVPGRWRVVGHLLGAWWNGCQPSVCTIGLLVTD